MSQELLDIPKPRNMVLTLIPLDGIIPNFISDSYNWKSNHDDVTLVERRQEGLY
jgi:hypothetical protein